MEEIVLCINCTGFAETYESFGYGLNLWYLYSVRDIHLTQ